MLVGDHEVTRPSFPWEVDNLFVGGEIKLGTYVLLHRGSEVARGNNPYEPLKIADALNDKEAA